MTNTQIDFSSAQIISVDTVNLKHIGPSAVYALSVLDSEMHNEWLSFWGHNGKYIWGLDYIADNDAWGDLYIILNNIVSEFGSSFGFSEHDGAVLGFWPIDPDSY